MDTRRLDLHQLSVEHEHDLMRQIRYLHRTIPDPQPERSHSPVGAMRRVRALRVARMHHKCSSGWLNHDTQRYPNSPRPQQLAALTAALFDSCPASAATVQAGRAGSIPHCADTVPTRKQMTRACFESKIGTVGFGIADVRSLASLPQRFSCVCVCSAQR